MSLKAQSIISINDISGPEEISIDAVPNIEEKIRLLKEAKQS